MSRLVRLAILASLLGALAPACTPAPCCRSDGDCGEGLGCFEGVCTYPCLHDDDCAAGELCVRPEGGSSREGVCVDPGASVGVCPERTPPPPRDGGLEDGGPVDTGVPPDEDAGAACVADFLEPNDERETASPDVSSPVRLTLCRADEDWIRVPARVGDVISAQLAFLHDEGDLDLALYGPEPGRPPVALSSRGEDTERIHVVADRSGEWQLRVFGVGGAENEYLLSFSVGPDVEVDGGPVGPVDGGPIDPGPVDAGPVDAGPVDAGPDDDAGPVCIVDTFEPNELPAQATTSWASPIDGHICLGDDDWFGIPATAGQRIVVEMRFSHALGDLDLRLRPPPGGGPDQVSNGTTDREDFDFFAPVTGTYLLHVFGFAAAENAYELEIDVEGGGVPDAGPVDSGPAPIDSGPAPIDSGPTPIDSGPPPSCTDPLEPNDSAVQASVGVITPVSLRICPGDEDWFAVDALPGQRIFARIRFVDAVGDLDMRLHGPDGNQVDSSLGTSDEELIDFTVSQPGRHTLRVWGFTGDTGPYDLELFVMGSTPCADDVFEDNDTRITAAPLPGDVVSAQLCPDDADFFLFDVGANEEVTVALAYDAPPGMRLRLVEATGGLIGESNTGAGLETLTFNRSSATRVLARITGPVDDPRFARPYTLVVQRPAACVDDGFEPNDNFASATPLSLPGSLTAQSCASDADFFSVDPGTASVLTVTLEAPPLLSAYAVVLGPTGPGFLGTVAGGAGPVDIPISADTPRPIYLIVAGNLASPYTLRVE